MPDPNPKDHYADLRQRAHEDCDREIVRAQARLKDRLAAIGVVEALQKDTDPPSARGWYEPPVAMTLVEAVRLIVSLLDGEFTIGTVRDALIRRYPDLATESSTATMSSTIRRVVDESGKIEVARLGKGRRPTTFRKQNNGAAPLDRAASDL